MCRPLQWIWGLVPVALLTVMAYEFVKPVVELELGQRAERALSEAGQSWARVSVEGRDVTLHGTAPNEAALAEALTAAAADGVRRVGHDVIVRVAPVN